MSKAWLKDHYSKQKDEVLLPQQVKNLETGSANPRSIGSDL